MTDALETLALRREQWASDVKISQDDPQNDVHSWIANP